MPKNIVDYSNTIIYKILCKDETIKDVYVGHTTNFIQRKYAHKIACNNLNNTLKIYNTIRSNGGWENWDMVEIAKYSCKDATEARIKEQHHYNDINASLNSCPPYVGVKTYFCDICNLHCKTSQQYNKHIICNSHIKKFGINHEEKYFLPKNAEFCCDICNFICYKKSNYESHLQTKKHNQRVNGNVLEPAEMNKNATLDCNCGKQFKTNAGLWKHKKVCNVNHDDIIENKDDPSDKELIIMLLKENAQLIKQQSEIKDFIFKEHSDLKEIILEIVKNGITNTTNNANNNTTTNSHNKAFNLHFFLNETCKNAMNITDFVDSIKLQLTDFMSIGEVGFVEGISNIIVNNLNSLDETVRPIHCTDQKRETFYVKDQNIWEKEDDEKKKMKQMIKSISYKNEKLMKTYKETYPDYNNSDSKRSDQYSKIMVEAMDCKDESREKIIKHISKVTAIKPKQ